MKYKFTLALAAAAAMFTGITVSQPAYAVPCNIACVQQYNLCLANTPHAALSCKDFLIACRNSCNWE
jgi:hypothetical protein